MPNDSRILFKDLVSQNETEIKTYMEWQNYQLNETIIPVVDLLKDHALKVLSNSYGLFHVEQTILNELYNDVFIYFPILMQQLSITRLIDAYGVVANDENTQTTTRTEKLNSNTDQNSTLTVGTSVNDSNVLDTQQKTTGTISTDNDIFNTNNSTTSIENSSGVEATGSKNVNLNHNMPEQSLVGQTGQFPTDSQGTPNLNTSYVQGASENFSTSNPINTNETSEQTITNTVTGKNENTTTNNVTLSDTGTTTRTTTNSGSDNSDSLTTTDSTNTITEEIKRLETNKQYAYEVKAFLETADGLIAFSRWEDKFSWVIGII